MKSMILDSNDYSLEMRIWHKRQYEFASLFLCKSDTVLDLGCGTGYGCDIMNNVSDHVYGIDIESDSIEHAVENYHNCNFVLGDIRDMSVFPQYDVVTCFNVLEHFSSEDGLVFLDKICKKTKLMFFLNIPTDCKIGENMFHKTEWSEFELNDILSQYFKRVVVLSQDWASGLIQYPYSEQHSFIMVVCIK